MTACRSESARHCNPDLSFVIPIYNEELMLSAAVVGLRNAYSQAPRTFEIILCENGSTDRTRAIAQDLMREFEDVIVLSCSRADYGEALRRGILAARGTYVICEEIDLLDTDFHARALILLEKGLAELVVGSKAMRGSNDLRPWERRLATRVVTGLLRLATGFRGTDTHGLKAMRRGALRETVQQCVLRRDLFASELVIRAQRSNRRVVEIPICVEEKRRPSTALLKRVPRVLTDLVLLFYVIRLQSIRPLRATGEITS